MTEIFKLGENIIEQTRGTRKFNIRQLGINIGFGKLNFKNFKKSMF